MNIAPSVRFRQLVENALTHLSWFESVASELGLTGISQIWDEEPAWYFWLGGRSYLLRYVDLAEAHSDNFTAALHVFPTREEWAENQPSACRHPLLTDSHFDFATMTPRFESFALFENAFIAGEATFSLADGELCLLAVSGYDQEWRNVWDFVEFFVAMLTFQRKGGPAEAPCMFSPVEKISTVLVSFDAAGAALAKALAASAPSQELPIPMIWHRLAREQFQCSASGTCTCSHEH